MKPHTNLSWQVLSVAAIIVLALWTATQSTAASLGWSRRLGEPWFVLFDCPVYAPWAFFGWWFAFDAYAPDIFDRGGKIAASGGLLAFLFAVSSSILRARWNKHVTTFGSSRWAEKRDMRKAGILGPGGVFLGVTPGAYLRHDGPDHVIAFAPTRSGKGVGLVIPTLLSWTHSAVVHDIKGENWQITAGWRALFSDCVRFDPTDKTSARFNPLMEVRKGDREVSDVQNIADILVDPEGVLEQRNHWEKTAHSLLVGVILHILYAESEKTLARAASFLSDPGRSFRATLAIMMHTNHVGTDDAPLTHPVVAQCARELMNKSENELSGVLSTAMSFLSLYRDPVIAEVTSQCDFRILDLVEGPRSLSLFLIIPPSDLSRTKPLIRLLLNQIGRRLMEHEGESDRRRVLFLLDEFPALGRLEFFESALAYMAHYRLKAFLITQSLNQIEKAYGPANAILDNCHVRVAFATNDERTARRISDGLGTKTEQRAMKNYAGHRLAPWLSHKMVSRQETARQLLTPGEIMQLPASDEIILLSGCPPILAKKLLYYADRNFVERLRTPPLQGKRLPARRSDDWKDQVRTVHEDLMQTESPDVLSTAMMADAVDNGGHGFEQAEKPIRPAQPRRSAQPHRPLQAGLFDTVQIADGIENASGVDLTGRGDR